MDAWDNNNPNAEWLIIRRWRNCAVGGISAISLHLLFTMSADGHHTLCCISGLGFNKRCVNYTEVFVLVPFIHILAWWQLVGIVNL
jgi:hypothetical protein